MRPTVTSEWCPMDNNHVLGNSSIRSRRRVISRLSSRLAISSMRHSSNISKCLSRATCHKYSSNRCMLSLSLSLNFSLSTNSSTNSSHKGHHIRSNSNSSSINNSSNNNSTNISSLIKITGQLSLRLTFKHHHSPLGSTLDSLSLFRVMVDDRKVIMACELTSKADDCLDSHSIYLTTT